MEPANKRIPIFNGDSSNNNPEPPSSTTDPQNLSASVADAASPDPATLRKQLAAQKDEYLRLSDDFDNFIKRSRRDAEHQAAVEKEAFIRDLLPILDNLERALASEQPDSCEPLHRGVTITLQEVGRLLQHHGIEPFEGVGLPFDPHRHEAVFVQHDPTQPDRIVLALTQRGYCCGDKVFRPAKVIVNDLSRYPGERYAR